MTEVACEIAPRWMLLDLTDDKSTSALVMARRHQATSYCLSQCWSRSMSPYGVTGPQWVNEVRDLARPVTYFVGVVWCFLEKKSVHIQGYIEDNPDNKVHGANMGPTWVLSAPGGPHVGPMNLPIWEHNEFYCQCCASWYPSTASGFIPRAPLTNRNQL